MATQDRGRARQPRLGIVDVYDLDRQRQLVLLRRDNVEHLLLIGGPNDLVVETNIARLPARAAAPGENGFDRADYGAEAPARPVVEPPRPSLDAGASPRLGSFAGPGDEASDAQAELAPIATTSPRPARAHMEPVVKPEAVAPARTPARPTGAGPAASVRTAEPRPADFAPADTPAGGAARAPEPSVLSDMAKQLEQALRRPAAPAPSQPASAPAMQHPEPAPAPPTPPPPRRPDVVRPAAPSRPVPTPRPAEPAPPPDSAEQPAAAAPDVPAPQPPAAPVAPPAAPAAQSALQAAPAPMPVARAAPAPSPTPAPPPAPASPPAPAPPPAASPPAPPRAGAADPFSVEEIEAEFARLLGRPLDKAENR
jgi:hypothetical protein